MRLVWTVIVASVALALARPVYAQSEGPESEGAEAEEATAIDAMDMAAEHMDDERARRHFEAGRNLYDAGAFERAGQEFEEAYALSNRPELLYNVYVAYRDAGDVRKSGTALRRYLAEVADVPDRVNLEARLANLEERAAELDAAEERQAQQAQAQAEAEAQAEASEQTSTPAPVEEGGTNVVPWIVAGVGAAALAAGAITGVMAMRAVGDIEDACPDDLCSADFDLEGEREDARTLVRATDFLLLGGGLLVAGGLTWALLSGDDGQEQAPVAAGCGPAGCTAELRGRF